MDAFIKSYSAIVIGNNDTTFKELVKLGNTNIMNYILDTITQKTQKKSPSEMKLL